MKRDPLMCYLEESEMFVLAPDDNSVIASTVNPVGCKGHGFYISSKTNGEDDEVSWRKPVNSFCALIGQKVPPTPLPARTISRGWSSTE